MMLQSNNNNNNINNNGNDDVPSRRGHHHSSSWSIVGRSAAAWMTALAMMSPSRSSRKSITMWAMIILSLNIWFSIVLTVQQHSRHPSDAELSSSSSSSSSSASSSYFLWGDPCLWSLHCKPLSDGTLEQEGEMPSNDGSERTNPFFSSGKQSSDTMTSSSSATTTTTSRSGTVLLSKSSQQNNDKHTLSSFSSSLSKPSSLNLQMTTTTSNANKITSQGMNQKQHKKQRKQRQLPPRIVPSLVPKGKFSYGREQIMSRRTYSYLRKSGKNGKLQDGSEEAVIQFAKSLADTQQEIQDHAAERILARMTLDYWQEEKDNAADEQSNNNLIKKHRHYHNDMSACLLIKDDNDILSEWIAYHYHTLKMRHLVVAVDPSSQTSPRDILRLWTKHTDLKVALWTDESYMPRSFLQQPRRLVWPEGYDPSKGMNFTEWLRNRTDYDDHMNVMEVATHRFRQKTFLLQCLQHLEQHPNNKTWVMHIDTDEYITVNPVLRQKLRQRQQQQQEQNGGIAGAGSGTPLDYPTSLLQYIPTAGPKEKNCIFDFLQQLMLHEEANRIQYPCISMPRFSFGSIENTGSTTVNMSPRRRVLNNNNASLHFESLRWNYHSGHSISNKGRIPKVIMDVSKVFQADEILRHEIHSIHRPSHVLCRNQDDVHMMFFHRNPLVVNHYLGSWERYSARSDSRRSREIYDVRANVQAGYDEWIVSWLDGFIEEHGLDLASTLLGDRTRLIKKTPVSKIN